MASDRETATAKRGFALPRWKIKPRRKGWKSDLALGVCGIALGLTCAFFPWYIFFNQEKFGVRAMKFEGIEATAPSAGVMPTYSATPPLSVSEVPVMELDLFSTGTVTDPEKGGLKPKIVLSQPFPATPPTFRLVHAANGRAMIEDDTGIWIVQRGSILPDDSRVTAIEQRNGRWVIVTDGERVLELSK